VELRHLRTFVAIVRCGGFRRAADELGFSQAALSKQMQVLEAELHVPLFARGGRRLQLTQAGRAFVERAEQVLADVETARGRVAAFARLERGHVRVGTLPGHGAPWTARLLGDFHERHPSIELALAEHTTEQLITLLLAREVDVACMIVPAHDWHPAAGINLLSVSRFELVVAVPPNHPFSTLDGVAPEDVADEPLIMPAHSSVAMIVERAFRRHGLVPRLRFPLEDYTTRLGLAAQGIGVAVTSREALAAHPHLALRGVTVTGLDLVGAGVVAWTDEGLHTPAVAALVDLVRTWRGVPPAA
jgi:DNA-binding transcriptional LysR family regulator